MRLLRDLLIFGAGYFAFTEKGRKTAISKFMQFGEVVDGAFNHALKGIHGKNIPAKSFTDIKNTPVDTPAAASIVENKEVK